MKLHELRPVNNAVHKTLPLKPFILPDEVSLRLLRIIITVTIHNTVNPPFVSVFHWKGPKSVIIIHYYFAILV